MASKGVDLTPNEMEKVVSGQVVEFYKQSPIMKLDGRQIYQSRNIEMKVNKSLTPKKK